MTDECTINRNSNFRNGNVDVVGHIADIVDALPTGNSERTSAYNATATVKKSLRTVARMSTERNAREYNMNHKYRGKAIIFSHETYDIPNLKPRPGNQIDCDSLKKTFEFLHFDVVIRSECTYKEIIHYTNKAAEEDHTDYDCIAIIILSHGTQGYIYARDTMYKLEKIASYFSADYCPSLAGKPKLFFLQACQGDNYDHGVDLKRTTETDSDGKSETFTIPSYSDFLFAYSTIPGYYSWRNPEKGSWYIQALCEELLENGKTCSILDILTFVHQKVAVERESNTPGDFISHEKKQQPCFTSSLMRILRFNDKNNTGTKAG